MTRHEKNLVKSLRNRDARDDEMLFVAEGAKVIRELSKFFTPRFLITCDDHPDLESAFPVTHRMSQEEASRLSTLKSSKGAIAVFEKTDPSTYPAILESDLVVALDSVQDPGNFGTILRIADWYGVRDVVCTRDSADAFNPKTVQASAGSLGRVRVRYVDDVAEYTGHPVLGAFLEGESIYETVFPANACILLGNEGRGIRAEYAGKVTRRITIPRPCAGQGPESLNVSVACALIFQEIWRRRVHS